MRICGSFWKWRRRRGSGCSPPRPRRPGSCCRPCRSRSCRPAAACGCWPAGRPARCHLEAVFLVGAVGDGLVVAAVLGLGEPVGAELDLGQLLLRAGATRRRALRKAAMPPPCASRVFICPLPLRSCPVEIADRAELAFLRARDAPRHWQAFVPRTEAHASGAPPMLRTSGDVVRDRVLPDAHSHAHPSIRPPFARYSHGGRGAGRRPAVFASGQLGIDARRRTSPTMPARRPSSASGRSARSCAAAGMDFADIVRINAFVTDREHLQALHGRARPLRRRRRRRPRP